MNQGASSSRKLSKINALLAQPIQNEGEEKYQLTQILKRKYNNRYLGHTKDYQELLQATI